MSRSLAIMGLSQVLLIILGFAGLGIVMKFHGYPHEGFGVRWHPMALYLRQQGMMLLLIPVLWTICAALAHNQQRFLFSLTGWLIFGVLIDIVIISVFLYYCIDPFYRPLLMHF